MNIKKLILSSVISLGTLTGFAQTAGEVIEYDFNPTPYIQVQVGGQETVGEVSFGDLLSPNAQIAVGYQWNPLFGARLAVNAWQSKAGMDFMNTEYKWKWNYVAPMVDLTFNLTNAIGGYNPNRIFDVNLIAGVGANIGFSNNGANDFAKEISTKYPDHKTRILDNLWDGTQVLFAGRVGAGVDFRINDNLKVGLELTANTLSDKYNSKKAANSDWYFNGLVGVKYSFGQTYNTRVVPVVAPVQEIIRETVYRDTVIIKEVAEPVTRAIEAPKFESFERNVFFLINQSVIRPAEMKKVEEIASYMKNHPGSMVHITGYADKGTGSLSINLRLARERANAVVKALTTKYGISGDRITSSSMTDELFQPYDTPAENRVAICVVE